MPLSYFSKAKLAGARTTFACYCNRKFGKVYLSYQMLINSGGMSSTP